MVLRRPASFAMIALVLVSSGCASAATCPAATTLPSTLDHDETQATRVAAAEEMVRLVVSPESLEAMMQVILDAMTQVNPQASRMRPVFDAFLERHFTVDELARRLAPLYATTFTEVELRQLIWFYRTEVGSHALRELPRLTQAGAPIGGQIVQDHVSELDAMVREYIATHPEVLDSPGTSGE